MATRRLCPRCRRVHAEPRCPHCAPAQRQQMDQRRGSSHDRGYTWRWRQAAKAFLAAHPLCYYSAKLGIAAAAEHVDHAIPPSGPDDPLFWDPANWRPATRAHNSAKGDKTEAEYLASLGVSP